MSNYVPTPLLAYSGVKVVLKVVWVHSTGGKRLKMVDFGSNMTIFASNMTIFGHIVPLF